MGQSLEEAVKIYYDDIYRFCAYHTGNASDSYDLAQETFLKVIKYSDLGKLQNVKGYLLTIAMNLCRDYWAKKERGLVSAEEFQLEDKGSVDYSYERAEIRSDLAAALNLLPSEQRESIILHYCYGVKIREISRMMRTNPSTVKSRLKQGTEKLRKIMLKP